MVVLKHDVATTTMMSVRVREVLSGMFRSVVERKEARNGFDPRQEESFFSFVGALLLCLFEF